MRYVGETAALGTALAWAAGSNCFAVAGREMNSRVLNRLRVVTAAVFLSLALLLTRGTPWPVWATPSQVALLGVSGLIGFVFGDSWYFRSLLILGPGRAALVASFSPVFTLLLAWPVLHEVPGPLAALGVALTLGGVAWVVTSRTDARPDHAEGSLAMGVLAGVLAAAGQAGGYVLSKIALRSGIDPLPATVIRVTVAMVAIGVLTAAQREIPVTLGALRHRRAAAFMVGGAFFGPFLGVTLSLLAIRTVQAGVASSIIAIYPVFTMLLAARMHGDRITARALAGALVAVAGVVVLFLR